MTLADGRTLPALSRDEIRGVSLWRSAGRRLVRNRAAVVGMIVLGIITLLALLAPVIGRHEMDEIFWDHIGEPPDIANSF
jgi:oligopeptide transport system permease protein